MSDEKMSMASVAEEVSLRIDNDDPDIPKLKKSGVLQIGQAFFDVISQAMAAGVEISVPKFGKFVPTETSERKGRNPQTGKAITIPAKTVPKFRASSVLRDAVAGTEEKSSKKKSGGKKKKSGGKKKKK